MTQQPMFDSMNRQWRQAGDTLRWLENGGPRYRDVVCTLVGVHPLAAHVHFDGAVVRVEKSHMSIGSWCICQAASPGDGMELRFRHDPVRSVGPFP